MSEKLQSPSPAIGPFLVGMVLSIALTWALSVGEMKFAYLQSILLVFLSLGAAVINKNYR